METTACGGLGPVTIPFDELSIVVKWPWLSPFHNCVWKWWLLNLHAKWTGFSYFYWLISLSYFTGERAMRYSWLQKCWYDVLARGMSFTIIQGPSAYLWHVSFDNMWAWEVEDQVNRVANFQNGHTRSLKVVSNTVTTDNSFSVLRKDLALRLQYMKAHKQIIELFLWNSNSWDVSTVDLPCAEDCVMKLQMTEVGTIAESYSMLPLT